MATVATYLFFPGNTEEAFEFYKSVFGTDYVGEGVMRMGDAPPDPDHPLTDEQQQQVMHVGLPILAGHMLMGTDNVEVKMGDNASIMLNPDTKEEADELFAKLSAGGSNVQPLADMFWGDYWGSCTDRFGVYWQIDVYGEPQG